MRTADCDGWGLTHPTSFNRYFGLNLRGTRSKISFSKIKRSVNGSCTSLTNTMSKYHNKKTEMDGIVFDSIKESRRYFELKLLEKHGEIKNLELQPKYLLQEGFYTKLYPEGKKKIRAIYYIADFQYEENGMIVAEDVKGILSPIYKMKKKLFLKKYPNLLLRET